MPEFEIALTFRGQYEDEADAFEHGDLVALTVEHGNPEIALDVKLAEVGP